MVVLYGSASEVHIQRMKQDISWVVAFQRVAVTLDQMFVVSRSGDVVSKKCCLNSLLYTAAGGAYVIRNTPPARHRLPDSIQGNHIREAQR